MTRRLPGEAMMHAIHLSGGRGEIDIDADELRIEFGALILSRGDSPVAVLAARTWTAVRSAASRPAAPAAEVDGIAADVRRDHR